MKERLIKYIEARIEDLVKEENECRDVKEFSLVMGKEFAYRDVLIEIYQLQIEDIRASYETDRD